MLTRFVFDKNTKKVGCAIMQAHYVGDYDGFALAAFDGWQTTIEEENAVVFSGTQAEWLERAKQHNALHASRK